MALGSQTALTLDGSGVRITSGEELAEIVLAGAEAGFPVAVHAIGDGANREALDAFERTRPVWEPLGLRHRVEHAQLLSADDLPRFAELGVACLSVLAFALDRISPSGLGAKLDGGRARP
jgi:predicted amidohydrolase YtcJ